ncbi:histone deacetylase sin3 component [Nannochloropsis gaditana]|uniref:Histone deacetylase sin3 component n=1 Tax=Nannochloropsis gaditana TaxID=72520 RepID=W7TF76_9STRA|nr:histone deacetylase sin3 component [Nannochloropsis gaditana]
MSSLSGAGGRPLSVGEEGRMGGGEGGGGEGKKSMAPGGVAGGSVGAGGAGGPLVEFKQAKDYVTTIKKRFASEPHQATYKAFLKILHHYQEEQRNIMDVLEQVSSLFADHPDLLKEFTYFLPDAVQEQAKERLNRAAEESEMRKAARQQQQAARMGGAWGKS